MSATSLVKFFTCRERNGRPVHWDRAYLDGLPFRGYPQLYTDEELERRLVRVADFHNGFFDVMDPEQNRRYLEIMDACANGWFQCLHVQRFWNGTTKHYVEWLEYFMEDGTRAGAGLAAGREQMGLPRSEGDGSPNQHPHFAACDRAKDQDRFDTDRSAADSPHAPASVPGDS